MTSDLTLFGIKNCDTVRKARRWLDSQNLAYHFHDWRVDGVDSTALSRAAEQLGWDPLVNRRSTTWRQLDEACRQSPPQALLLDYPTLIKRPLLSTPSGWLVGFNAQHWQAQLAEVSA